MAAKKAKRAAKRAVTPEERLARHRRATGYAGERKPPPPPAPPSTASTGATQRCKRLIGDLQAALVRLEDADLPDDEARALASHVNALWATHIGAANLEKPALMALIHCVETANRPTSSDAAFSAEALQLFRALHPELASKLSRQALQNARESLRTQKKWSVLADLARSCGLQPPPAKSLKEAWSRKRAQLLKNGWFGA